jgi:hypothetical protein
VIYSILKFFSQAALLVLVFFIGLLQQRRICSSTHPQNSSTITLKPQTVHSYFKSFWAFSGAFFLGATLVVFFAVVVFVAFFTVAFFFAAVAADFFAVVVFLSAVFTGFFVAVFFEVFFTGIFGLPKDLICNKKYIYHFMDFESRFYIIYHIYSILSSDAGP